MIVIMLEKIRFVLSTSMKSNEYFPQKAVGISLCVLEEDKFQFQKATREQKTIWLEMTSDNIPFLTEIRHNSNQIRH